MSTYAVPTTSFVPSSLPGATHSVLSTPLDKPERDTNDYRLLRLRNGLQALLISDKTADKAAAAMNIGVGHLDDPADVPGCAHFCEHLSFMGTKQFPKENEYQEFIQTHGGHTNAYTAASDTNYYFDISAPQLLPALERFSTFFHSPLFSKDATTKEIQAVDSEHKKNLNSDSWRTFQLFKSLSAPGHVWAKFGSGNAKSLRADVEGGLETREKLIQWWERSYAAPRMGLCVLGRESLDELEKAVVQYFDPVPDRGLTDVPIVEEPALGPEQVGRIVFARTVMDFRQLEITWSIPWQSPLYLVKPANFLSHFLGHEGPGSLYAYLKKQGWAMGLSAGKYGGGRGFDFFKVTVALTEEGYKKYESVLVAIYKYISLLRSSPLPAWYQDELITLSALAYRFREKQASDRVVSYFSAEILEPYPRENVTSTGMLVREWDEKAVRELLDGFTPRTSLVVLESKDVDAEKVPLREEHYGTEYGILPMSEDFLARAEAQNDIPDLHLPLPNAFIPENLKVDLAEAVAEPAKRPSLIVESPLVQVWHKKDDQFLVPRAHVRITLKSPMCNATPRQHVKTRMFGELLRDALSEYSYDAALAGLSFDASGSGSLSLSIDGYNDKLPVLLQTVLEKVKTLKVEKERFEVLREEVKQDWGNFWAEQPYEQAGWWAGFVLQERVWRHQDRLQELDALTVEDVQTHANELMSRVHVKMLVVGNVSKEAAKHMVSTAEGILTARPLSSGELVGSRVYLLPYPSNFVWQGDVTNTDDPNSALTYFVQVGDSSDRRLRATLSLFSHIVHEPCFTELRTNEQLGYIVSSSMYSWTGVMGFHVVIQSERDPAFLESRVEVFFDFVKKMLEEMKEGEFEAQKEGLIAKKLEKVKNLYEEAQRYWAHIKTGYEEFLRSETDAEHIRTLTRQEVLDLFVKHIHPSSPTRAKLSIHLLSPLKPGSVPKFTVEAAKALLPELKRLKVPIDEKQYFELSAPEPPVEAVKAFFGQFLPQLPHLSDADKEEIIAALDRATKAHPAAVPAETKEITELPPGAVRIEDIALFQAGLQKSRAAVPVSYEEGGSPRALENGTANGHGTAKL